MNTLLKSISYVASVLLVIVAVGLAFVALPWFGNKALIVRSGSMEPAIKVGDLVVVNPKGEGLVYKEGDIIAFKGDKDPKILTTHRIVATQTKDGKLFYETKGDANKDSDNGLVASERVIGKVVFLLPYAGRVFAFTKSNIGFPLLVIFPALFVIVLEVVNIFKEIRRQRGKSQGPLSPSVSLNSLVVLIPLVISGLFIQNSHAFFSDTETSVNNIFTADTCFGSGDHVVINEVFYDVGSNHDGQGSENNWEWVELFNPTASTMDLTGWSLGTIGGGGTFGTFSGTPSLAPCGFAIVSPSTSAELEDQTNDGGRWDIPDATIFITLSDFIGGNGLNNGGDNVVLRDNASTEIDKMSYGSDKTGFSSGCTPTACPSVATDHSLEREPDGFDTDSASDFVDRATPTPGL